jgi:hypothetical protein
MGARKRRPRYAEMLHRTVRQLVELDAIEPPAKLPYYVSQPGPGQLAGWFWQPAGAPRPEALGSNAYYAEAALERLLPEEPAA